MTKKLVNNWPMMLAIAALATVSISSLAMATCDAIMSGDGGDGDWVVNSLKGESESVPSGLEDAEWIWLGDIYDQGSHQFTRTFEIPGTPTSGTMLIACDDYYYDLVLNNAYIGENRNVNGWLTADVYDVTPYLHSGINTLSVTAENDMWNWGGLSYKLDFCWNNPPIAEDDSVNTNENTALVIDVKSNDYDPDEDTLTVTSVTKPDHGIAEIKDNVINYKPDLWYSGEDSFQYIITDTTGLTATATVTITIEDTISSPEDICAFIQSLPNEAFKNNVDNRKTEFCNKLAKISNMIANKRYTDASNKLKNDILPKVDSDPHAGWITDTGAQEDLCSMVDTLLDALSVD
jgi:hypothetical protein